jgi:thiamine-monophosphate kinase
MPSEFELINWIRAQTPRHGRIVIPPGDDLAALRWDVGDLLLAGADQVLDGVHFSSAVHSPRDIGRKAMNRNFSDCAAMACLPAAAVVTVALSKGTSIDYAKELYLGMKDAGAKYDCPIVGGDTGSWDGKLAISVSILGRSAGITPLTRSGATPNHLVYVTGPLGGSIRGRHMTFEPRIQLARKLAELGASAMIDISDGLSRDIAHICRESGIGVAINAADIPIHDDAIEMRRDGHSPLEHALHDGEDYELLFTMPIFDASNTPIALPPGVHNIGMCMKQPGVWLANGGQCEALEPKSWEHRF